MDGPRILLAIDYGTTFTGKFLRHKAIMVTTYNFLIQAWRGCSKETGLPRHGSIQMETPPSRRSRPGQVLET